jgi:hypothetical protein
MSSESRRGAKTRLHRHARRREKSTKEAAEIVRHDQNEARKPLGSRIRARFAEIGLDDELPELRGEPARPATFEK